MSELNIDSNWNFEEIVKHLKAIRNQYEDILSSFSCFEIKDKIKFKKETRDKIYSLNCSYWQMNKIWEYLNGYEFLYTLKNMISREKNKHKTLKNGQKCL